MPDRPAGSAVEPAETVALAEAVLRLHAGVLHWSPARWAGAAPDGRVRADVLFALVADLAELARRAGSGAPPEAQVPRLGNHALVDQLAVLGAEVVAADGVEQVAPQAREAVEAARRVLLP